MDSTALPELDLGQRRQLIDAQQRYTEWRRVSNEFKQSYKGSMGWHRKGNVEYLRRIISTNVHQGLGARSPETERLKEQYTEARKRLRTRLTKLGNGIKADAKLNRAQGLARVPRQACAVLRALDDAGLLGNGIHVVGTHSLYAYEAASGMLFTPDLLATSDLDLMADVRTRMVLAVQSGSHAGVMAALKSADNTYSVDRHAAINDDGFAVELIRPTTRREAYTPERDVGGLTPAGVDGLKMLINAPRFESIAIGEDGMPVWIATIDPRAYALQKAWLSVQIERDPKKRRRDLAQAHAVVSVAKALGLAFAKRDLSALPKDLVSQAEALLRSTGPDQ